MSWTAFLDLIAAESGPEMAARIRERAERELPGLRFTIPRRPSATVTDEELRRALRENRWNVDATAALLGLSRSAIYRRLHKDRLSVATMNRALRRSDPWD